MEQYDLTITTTNTYLVVGNSLDRFDTLSADRLTKNEHLIFDLIGTEITRFGSNEEEFLIWFGEGHASVISYH